MVELDEIGEEGGGAEISFREYGYQFLFKKYLIMVSTEVPEEIKKLV